MTYINPQPSGGLEETQKIFAALYVLLNNTP